MTSYTWEIKTQPSKSSKLRFLCSLSVFCYFAEGSPCKRKHPKERAPSLPPFLSLFPQNSFQDRTQEVHRTGSFFGLISTSCYKTTRLGTWQPRSLRRRPHTSPDASLICTPTHTAAERSFQQQLERRIHFAQPCLASKRLQYKPVFVLPCEPPSEADMGLSGGGEGKRVVRGSRFLTFPLRLSADGTAA